MNNENIDIFSNMRVIESYKSYLLSAVADLFSTMTKGGKAGMDEIVDELADITMLSYLLGKRLGVNYAAIDDKMLKKLKLGVVEENNIEKEYQDYSKLMSYIRDGREL
jgi:small basic protein